MPFIIADIIIYNSTLRPMKYVNWLQLVSTYAREPFKTLVGTAAITQVDRPTKGVSSRLDLSQRELLPVFDTIAAPLSALNRCHFHVHLGLYPSSVSGLLDSSR